MQGQYENLEKPSSYPREKAVGNFLLNCLGSLIGLIYFPLTMPFIYAAANMHNLQKTNVECWNKYKPDDRRTSPLHYISAAFVIAGNSLLKFVILVAKFPWHIFYSMWLGIRDGFKGGPLNALTAPAYSFNRYHTTGKKLNNTLHFRTSHALILGLIITLIFCAVMTTLLIFFPWIFAPLTVLTQLTGFNLAALLGVKAVGLMLPLLNFTSLLVLTLPLVYGVKAAVFALVTLGQATGEFVGGLIRPRSQGYIGTRLRFVLGRLASLIDKCVAMVVGIPLYLIFKPYYQILDSLRLIHKSNKSIWRSGKVESEKKEWLIVEWLYKIAVLFVMLLNTIARLILAPIQVIASILYAPLQSVRHATKYGMAYVLAYPQQFANSYRGQLVDGDNNEYRGDGKNYDKIHVKKYENVYYFRKAHIAVLAIIVGLALVLLASFIPPLGFLSISLSVKLLTPLGLAQFSLTGAAVLIINFITGVAATVAVAVALRLASWIMNKLSMGLGILKRFFSNSNHFHNFFHRSVTAGDAFQLMKNENLAVKTIASNVDPNAGKKRDTPDQEIKKFGTSWVFNLDQLKNPAGVGIGGERPIYRADDKQRACDRRHKTYNKWNPKTGVWKIKEITGKRGRAKIGRFILSILTFGLIPVYTKKTNMSLVPKDGMMAFFVRDINRDAPIGLAFDMNKVNTKGDKYVFIKDAWTNLKWMWEWIMKDPDAASHVQPSTSLDGLRSHNRALRTANQVPEHNDILACLTKDSLAAVITPTKNVPDRINALFRKLIIKYELGVDLPILIMGTLNNHNGTNEKAMTPQEYTVEQQLIDLFNLSRDNCNDTESKRIFNAVATHYAHGRNEAEEKKSFVRALVNSHPVNWATLFGKLDKHKGNTAEFTAFIKDAAAINLNHPVDYKYMPTHYVACSA